MEKLLENLERMGVLPVVVIEDAKHAIPLGKALMDGGLPCAEVTFRTAAAEESIRKLTQTYPEMIVGAGTVLSIEQAKRAVDAGAQFIVSPGFDPDLVDYCLENKIPVVPGCVTPSELTSAHKRGLNVVKFFPAEAMGGMSTIKAVSAPFVQMKFMPTGGIDLNNLHVYLSNPKVLTCGGSWLVKKQLIAEERFDEIQKMVEETVQVVHSIQEGKGIK